jgi:hypothetical protein
MEQNATRVVTSPVAQSSPSKPNEISLSGEAMTLALVIAIQGAVDSASETSRWLCNTTEGTQALERVGM